MENLSLQMKNSVSKAPAHLVEEERNKLADYKEKFETVKERLAQLQK